MRIEQFDDTRAMTEPALRAALADGDARSRVYAVWALALRITAVDPLTDHLRGEPDAGVRRSLAVVLAGKGELDLVVALARHDPDVHVRAGTSQLIVRFARAGRIPWSVIGERFADDPDVRSAVLSQIDADAPAEIYPLVVRGLDDDDQIVRREAFDATLRLYLAGKVDGAVLPPALDRMPAAECNLAIARWLAADSVASIAATVASGPQSVRGYVLRARPHLAFTDLFPLLANDFDLFERLRYTLPRYELAWLPLPFILRLAARSHADTDCIADVNRRLATCDAAAADVLPLLSDLRTACQQRLSWIEHVDEELCPFYVEELAQYSALRTHLARLLGPA